MWGCGRVVVRGAGRYTVLHLRGANVISRV